MHPSVHAERKTLFESKKAEEEKPEHAGRRIALAIKKRQVTCDGQVIDSWSEGQGCGCGARLEESKKGVTICGY